VPWKPSFEGELPTLGWYVLDWMHEMLARPALGYYEPFTPYREQEDFILRFYEIDPTTGRFRYNRALLGRPRGWGKSPILGAMCIVEGLADVVFDGWDADGQPVGKPWTELRTPLIHVAAVAEDQVRNTWQPMVEMLSGPVADEFDVEPFDTVVNLPRGRIEMKTSAPRSIKGAPSTFAVLDQTEEWIPANKGPVLAQNIRTNTAKNGGRTIESPNAFIPGENSVAEQSEQFAQAILQGRTKHKGLLYDHREAPADTDLTERESLILGLRYAYGDSSGHPDGCIIHQPPCAPGHVDLDEQINVIWDPATDPQKARSDYLNQITHASDSWLTRPDWAARSTLLLHPEEPWRLTKGDTITLGFDGSRKRTRGKSDATALVAVRVKDGFVQPLRIWEQPDGPEGDEWRVPVDEVKAEVDAAFREFRVVGFYADPAKWEGVVADWEAKYGSRLKVKAGRTNPIEWWFTGGRASLITRMLESFYNAVMDGELTHSGDVTLTQHILNARRRTKATGYQIYKQHPDSPHKIDAAIASALAWQARLDALAGGHSQSTRTRIPRRIN
jgi:hypothetical protein